MLRDHAKSVVKALSWRVCGALDTFAIAFFVTGKMSAAGSLVGFEVATKTVWYYFHERAWS
jgi:uncharacterized membrane protein